MWKISSLNPKYMVSDAGQICNTKTGNISSCCRGRRHTAGGFVWRDIKGSSTTIENESEQSRVI